MSLEKGRLIAVEGIDGSGKSTQIHLIKRWLELSGVKVFFTEWNSSLLVERSTQKGKKRKLLTPTTFSLIHATDFCDRYESQVLPLLKAGYVVLCDRYVYTAFARDAARGCDMEWVRKLYSFATKPDITFFFNLSLRTALTRLQIDKSPLKYHEMGMDLHLAKKPFDNYSQYQQRLHDEYSKMVEEYDFVVINASDSIEELQEQLREAILQRIDLSPYRWRNR